MIRVLAIDDEPDILAVVEGALEIEGHQVVVATDPTQAVDLAIEHAIDVIILDVNMPGLSGFETLEALRQNPRTAGLPILFLSALGDSQHRIRGLRRGADDYLAKPFEPDELVLRVERLQTQLHRAGVTEGSAPQRVEDALRSGEFRPGDLYFGRYQALEILAEGAMGVVLRGWDPRLKRPVALKTLRVESAVAEAGSSTALGHMIHEAAVLARFSHPNIVVIYDAGSIAQITFIVMELVDGISLHQRLANGPLKLDMAAHLGVGVARALTVAHANQMVHRDIKPGNILLGRGGAVKVTDFGLADLVSSLSADPYHIYGTPGFVPPECLYGEPHLPAGDLFGLGAVLYRALTGSSAFDGETARELLTRTLMAEIVPPDELREDLPPEVAGLVLELLSREPERRPTAPEVEQRLAPFADAEPTWELDSLPERRQSTAAVTEAQSARFIDTSQLPGT